MDKTTLESLLNIVIEAADDDVASFSLALTFRRGDPAVVRIGRSMRVRNSSLVRRDASTVTRLATRERTSKP